MTHARSTGGVVLTMAVLVAATGAHPTTQSDTPPLYACAEATTAEVTRVGLTACDATPTAELEARAEADNLQVRAGALVVELNPEGISATEGLQSGDMIYRVGGVDVASVTEAADHLARIVADTDTVVNFLRGGRPYRVKLRR